MIVIREKRTFSVADPEQGSALVMSVLILLILSIIGVYAVNTSTVETKITGVERGLQEAFYTADSGEPIGVFLTKTILQDDPQDINTLGQPWSDVITDSNFISSREIYTNATDRNWDEDIDSTGDSDNLGLPSYVQLLVDIDRLEAHHMPGGGVEFAAGYEGIGLGGGGDVGILYSVDSRGTYSVRGAESELHAGYLHVPGIVGEEE